jgi:hypothetical protein
MKTPQKQLTEVTREIVKTVATGMITITENEVMLPQKMPNGIYYIVLSETLIKKP